MKREKNGEARSATTISESRNIEIADAIDAWNATAKACGWHEVHSLSDARRQLLNNLLEQVGIQGVRAAITKAGWSEWLGGDEPPAWFTFDALLDPDKYKRLMSGDYDKRFH